MSDARIMVYDADEWRPRRSPFFLDSPDTPTTRAAMSAMQRQIEDIFRAYDMGVVGFRAERNVMGEHVWELDVRVTDDEPPYEVSTFGSPQTRYIRGRRGCVVRINGDRIDIQRARSESHLFEQIAQALHFLVRTRFINGETITMSCHELLVRYRERGGEGFDNAFPLHSRYSASDDARWQRELLDNWHFTPHDVKKIEKQLDVDDAGPTPEQLRATYEV